MQELRSRAFLHECFDSISIYQRFPFSFVICTEYAAVGYIAKRIEMRKKRYQNLQKLAEQRRAALAINAGGADGDQTASTVAKNVSFFLGGGSFKKKCSKKHFVKYIMNL